jgi:DNA-binding NtrC family response regulator
MPENSNAGIAIVDDDAELVRTYEMLFRRRSVPVSFVAYDGCSALEKFKAANPRPMAILIDNRMPFMCGLDLMKEILMLEPGTRIVFISADDRARQEALDAGAYRFLKKPTGLKEIMESIGPLSRN